jgi:hypothetical protein
MEPEPRQDNPAIHPAHPRIPPSEHSFPTLQAIDHARPDNTAEPFATDLHAASLEVTARRLVHDWWPDTVWLTGHIDQRLLDAVVSRLERERDALDEAVRIYVAPATRQAITPSREPRR